MKFGISILLLLASLSAQDEALASDASMSYKIAFQNEVGLDQQTVRLAIGAGPLELTMAGAAVQISPPNTADGPSVLKFFSVKGDQRVLLHTAKVRTPSESPLDVAYTLCGESLRFLSPAPARLEKCPDIAKQPSNFAIQPLGGSVTINDWKISCGGGLLPLAVEGKLEGLIDVPGGKVSFPGGQARLGYCGRPIAGAPPTLLPTESLLISDAESSITDPNGRILTCANGQLPLSLEGSAKGSVSTAKGIVSLHGGNNKVAVCLALITQHS